MRLRPFNRKLATQVPVRTQLVCEPMKDGSMPDGIVLQSWKEISAHVGRTERTLQRWERDFGFPIHRPSGTRRSAVIAVASEIQEWLRATPMLQMPPSAGKPQSSPVQLHSQPGIGTRALGRTRRNILRNTHALRQRSCTLLQQQQRLSDQCDQLLRQYTELARIASEQRLTLARMLKRTL